MDGNYISSPQIDHKFPIANFSCVLMMMYGTFVYDNSFISLGQVTHEMILKLFS